MRTLLRASRSTVLATLLGCCAALLADPFPVCAEVVIDTFDGDHAIIAKTAHRPVADSLAKTTALGGTRSYFAEQRGGPGTLRLETRGGILSHAAEHLTLGRSLLVWDGSRNRKSWDGQKVQGIKGNGLGKVRLGNPATDGLIITLSSFDFAFSRAITLTIRVYDTRQPRGTKYSEGTLLLTSPYRDQTVYMPFSQFFPIGEGGASFDNVGALSLLIDGGTGPSLDLGIDTIKAGCVKFDERGHPVCPDAAVDDTAIPTKTVTSPDPTRVPFKTAGKEVEDNATHQAENPGNVEDPVSELERRIPAPSPTHLPAPSLTSTVEPKATITPVPTQALTVSGVYEGLTPEFWAHRAFQQIESLDESPWFTVTQLTGKDPFTATVGDLFKIPEGLSMAPATLRAALEIIGNDSFRGAAQFLLQQATAAWANSIHPKINYPLSTAQVIDATNAALKTKDRTAVLSQADTFQRFNKLGGSFAQ